MRKKFSILNIIRAEKKISLLVQGIPEEIEIMERSKSYNKIGNKLEEISNDLAKQKLKKNRFDILELKIDNVLSEIGEMKKSLNILLLLSLHQEGFLSYSQKKK